MPCPLSSIVAARALKELEFIIDFIYLDSAHEKGETYAELVLYFELLRGGGLICGDDYNWEAVNHDVQLFTNGLDVNILFPKSVSGSNEIVHWCIQKPLSG